MVRQRSEIDRQYIWSIDEIYEEGEIEEDRDEVRKLTEQLKEYRGSLENIEAMESFIRDYSRCMRKLSKLGRYASMKSDEDLSDQDAQALKSEINSFRSEILEETSFVKLEIQKLGEERIEEMIEENEEIESRAYWLREFIRMKPHTRSEEIEEVLSSLGEILDAPSETYSMLSNADMEFPSVEKDGEEVLLTQSNFTRHLRNRDREFRREVYEGYFETLEQYKNTIGTTFSKNVRSDVKTADIRNYSSSREAALKSSNIPVDVYDNLLDTVGDNLDVLHEHLKLKAEARGIEDAGMHDVYLPVPESESPEISYEEAKDHIIQALEPLGEEYVERVRRAFDDRWIDVYESENKRSGAYSGGSYDTKPFILMNYQEDITSMFTLAHELGHSMHSQFSSENQSFLHSQYEIFVAEVASTVNEALLARHLLQEVEDEEFRKHVLSHSLENFRSTLFRQTMFADFEKQIHQKAENGEPITPEKANEVYGSLKNEFYAPYQTDDHIRSEWMRIPHFYNSFYVYQYATGVSAAKALSKQILEEGPEDYLEFLKSGGSDSPINLLKKAGVDMTSPKPVEEAIELYSQRISEMREALK